MTTKPFRGRRVLTGRQLGAVAFPLGGIGTGNVSLGGRGQLCDWEIFNHAGKGVLLPNTFFALRAQVGVAEPVTRVLEGPLLAPHNESHGYHPSRNAGLPRMRDVQFTGAYPIATIQFRDPSMPLAIELEAYTPLVPLDPADSGLPCAILTYTIENLASEATQITLVGSLANPIGGIGQDRYKNLQGGGVGGNHNQAQVAGDIAGLFFTSEQYQPDSLQYGNLALTTTHPTTTIKRAWLRGAWYDYLREFWDDLASDGELTDLGYTTPSAPGQSDTGSLGLVDTLSPGERRSYTFILSWYLPNRAHGWEKGHGPNQRNQYATRFASAWEVAEYVTSNFERLRTSTYAFHDALFGSSLPEAVIDAFSANITALRSPTCFWLDDGNFYGWEGCFDDGGCCEGSCTHVWAYAYTVAILFPQLERVMRTIEFAIETEPDGYMTFRTFKTFGERFIWTWGEQKPEAAVDGQMGSVLRVYREWLWSADRAWLDAIWPGVRRAVIFATRQWDRDGDGVLDGRQHNTYDIEFYGPNPLSTFYHLAALRAAEELALVLGESEFAGECRAAFERGRERAEELLWNGEYYQQQLDDIDQHPYQHGAGCLADQLLGLLHAELLGLGEIVASERAQAALQAIMRHNFRDSFHEHVNCQRTYALNDEQGLLLCTWPQGGRPRFPFPYSDEVWPGIEYQVAAHLFLTGSGTEALKLVEAVRARHDGERRNPWNEVECGHHYARSMASGMLLLALTGFQCNLAEGWIQFAPLAEAYNGEELQLFWACGRGWGSYTEEHSAGQRKPVLTVLGGDLAGMQLHACGGTWAISAAGDLQAI